MMGERIMQMLTCFLMCAQIVSMSDGWRVDFHFAYSRFRLGNFPESEKVIFEGDLASLKKRGLADGKIIKAERALFRKNHLRVYNPILLFRESPSRELMIEIQNFCMLNREYDLCRDFAEKIDKTVWDSISYDKECLLQFMEWNEFEESGYAVFPNGKRKIFFRFPCISPRADSPLGNQIVEWRENVSKPNSLAILSKDATEVFRRDYLFSCQGLWSPSGERLALSFEEGTPQKTNLNPNPFGRFSGYIGSGKEKLIIIEKNGKTYMPPVPPVFEEGKCSLFWIRPLKWESDSRLRVVFIWEIGGGGNMVFDRRKSSKSKKKEWILVLDRNFSCVWEEPDKPKMPGKLGGTQNGKE